VHLENPLLSTSGFLVSAEPKPKDALSFSLIHGFKLQSTHSALNLKLFWIKNMGCKCQIVSVLTRVTPVFLLAVNICLSLILFESSTTRYNSANYLVYAFLPALAWHLFEPSKRAPLQLSLFFCIFLVVYEVCCVFSHWRTPWLLMFDIHARLIVIVILMCKLVHLERVQTGASQVCLGSVLKGIILEKKNSTDGCGKSLEEDDTQSKNSTVPSVAVLTPMLVSNGKPIAQNGN